MVNATILEPWAVTVNYLMDTLKIVVGGLFGLYVIEFVYRFFFFRKLRKEMNRLFEEIHEVKERLGRMEKKK
jgi:hypothetical protein